MGVYLTKQLATIATLMDKSMRAVLALYDGILHHEGGGHREPRKALWFDITHGFACRAPFTKLVELYGDIYPYLTVLITATLAWA